MLKTEIRGLLRGWGLPVVPRRGLSTERGFITRVLYQTSGASAWHGATGTLVVLGKFSGALVRRVVPLKSVCSYTVSR